MIARLLFSSLLNSLLNKVDSEMTKKDAAELTAKINAGISNMLTTTTQFYTPFIACLLVCSLNVYLVLLPPLTIICLGSFVGLSARGLGLSSGPVLLGSTLTRSACLLSALILEILKFIKG